MTQAFASYLVDQLLNIVSHYSGLLLLLIMCLYIIWYILSAPLFYMLRKRKGVKDGLMTVSCMEAQWTTLWVDLSNRELAYLCMLNPFQIHYLPLDSVSSAAIDVHYTKDKAFIHYLNCSFCINGRPNKIRVDTSSRYSFIVTETEGQKLIGRTQKFVDLLSAIQQDDRMAGNRRRFFQRKCIKECII